MANSTKSDKIATLFEAIKQYHWNSLQLKESKFYCRVNNIVCPNHFKQPCDVCWRVFGFPRLTLTYTNIELWKEKLYQCCDKKWIMPLVNCQNIVLPLVAQSDKKVDVLVASERVDQHHWNFFPSCTFITVFLCPPDSLNSAYQNQFCREFIYNKTGTFLRNFIYFTNIGPNFTLAN